MRFLTKITRDIVLFAFGLSGIAYETLATGTDRPTLLVLFGAMAGLGPILRADERRSSKGPLDKTEVDE